MHNVFHVMAWRHNVSHGKQVTSLLHDLTRYFIQTRNRSTDPYHSLFTICQYCEIPSAIFSNVLTTESVFGIIVNQMNFEDIVCNYIYVVCIMFADDWASASVGAPPEQLGAFYMRLQELTRWRLVTPYDVCLSAPSHYLNKCWLSIKDVLWQNNFTRSTHKLSP